MRGCSLDTFMDLKIGLLGEEVATIFARVLPNKRTREPPGLSDNNKGD